MPSLKLPNQQEIKRYYTLFSVLTKYGFEDVMAHSGLLKLIPKKYLKSHPDTERNLALSTYERIRMVLEELGPTYVKLGQLFSNREDLLPPTLTKELEKLQDHALALKDFNVKELVEQELKTTCDTYFQSIETSPLAAASMAQVHRATLLDGTEVILKIQRPQSRETIEADIAIMKQVAKSLETYSSQVKAFQPRQLIASFEKSIKEELAFLHEADNTEHFARDFEGVQDIYVPKIFRKLSTNKLICMEYIDGIKVSDIQRLEANGIHCKEVAQRGVALYLTQILDHGFFHADPHPGNIFVLPKTEQICFIDFGMMGTLMPQDQEILEDLLVNFMKKDIDKIIPLLEKLAIKASISDYKKLKYDVYELIESVSNTPIEHIKMGTVLNQFKAVLYGNQITLPHSIYMLIRGLIVIEGVGLKLDPTFSITENLKPYVTEITRKRFSLKQLIKKNLSRIQNFNKLADTFPDDFHSIVKKVKEGKLVLVHEINGLKDFQHSINKATNRLVLAVINAALSIGSSILMITKMPPLINGVPLLGAFGFVLSAILGVWIIFSIFKSKEY
ncbi:AarF/UbiB family protein [Flavobacteriaceae bacterium F08102]|nr:AarF/UbiB family protein [Flavobacteriaceae bacterium F08102]